MIVHLPFSDVTGKIDLTAPVAVANEICAIFSQQHPDFDDIHLRQGFTDLQAICAGQYPGLLACDMPYHNLSHFLDTALLMARLVNGYERSHEAPHPLTATQCSVAVLLALFHDIGLFRSHSESHLHGASLLLAHEQRGVEWMHNYLCHGPLSDYASQAQLIFATDLDHPIAESLANLPPELRIIAQMLGTADVLSQVSGRYYLENCRDLLYQELQLAQIGYTQSADGEGAMGYSSPLDLLQKTPAFYAQVIEPRLEHDLARVYRYEAFHFDGDTPYERGMQHNLAYLDFLIERNDLSVLRRQAAPGL